MEPVVEDVEAEDVEASEDVEANYKIPEVNQYVISRLKNQRKEWRKNHPPRFSARAQHNLDGSLNLCAWQAIIPGPKGLTPWKKGYYRLTLDFHEGYPLQPPICVFNPVPPHPNIYPQGTVRLAILNEEEDWKPYYSIATVLLALQKLFLEEPNYKRVANKEVFLLYKNQRLKYLEQALDYARIHSIYPTFDKPPDQQIRMRKKKR